MTQEPILEEQIREAYRDGGDCPAIEALSRYAQEPGTAEAGAIAEHVDRCPACAAEVRLAREFESAGYPVAGDSAPAVGRLVRSLESLELAKRSMDDQAKALVWTPRRKHSATRTRSLRTLALAAAVLAMLALGGVITRQLGRAPALPDPVADDVVRGGVVEILRPQGDLQELPRSLSWVPVELAAGYRVTVRGVDGVKKLSTEVAEPRWDLGSEERATLQERVRYHWDVLAFDAGGAEIARSRDAVFRALPSVSGEQGDRP